MPIFEKVHGYSSNLVKSCPVTSSEIIGTRCLFQIGWHQAIFWRSKMAVSQKLIKLNIV